MKTILHLKRKIKSQYTILIPYIQNKYNRIIRRDSNRFVGCVIISLILHIGICSLLLGLLSMDKKIQVPIREINFVDLTEDYETNIKKRIKIRKKKKRTKFVKTIYHNPINYDKINDDKSSIVLSKKSSLDVQKKQVPISIKPATKTIIKADDHIKIVPANSTKFKKQISPIKLDTNKESLITTSSQNKINFPSTKKRTPKINLDEKKLNQSSKKNSISLSSKMVTAKSERSLMKLKQTKTYITGPLANRPIIYKIIPSFPQWAKKEGVGATISLKFTVMEDGAVKENIVIERTSGSRDWDQLVISALKRWKFSALTKADVRHNQTGVITFQFVI